MLDRLVKRFPRRPWHVWMECWMRREDLLETNAAWQVIDPSSMECIGPCSVAALKSHELGMRWDTATVDGLLNGTRTWISKRVSLRTGQ